MITTDITALDLGSVLGKEIVTAYEAEDVTVDAIVTALLAFQLRAPEVTKGTIHGSYASLTRSIKVDGDSILRALFRLRDTVGGYIFVDKDRKLQWVTTLGETKGQQLRYRKNLLGIQRTMDYTKLVNRLYAYGRGEGDEARIKLSDAEGHAEDYVEDAQSQIDWDGIYPGVVVDPSITHPDTLVAWATLKLADIKDPLITYDVDTVALEAVRADFIFETLELGSTVTVIDEDLGINVSCRVVRIERPDLLRPHRMIVELANKVKDILDSLGSVYDMQQFGSHIATVIGAGQVVVKGTFTVIDWVTGGETTIDGSNITTGTITALQIMAGTITADEIAADAITTIHLQANSVTVEKLDVDELSAITAHMGLLIAGEIRLGTGEPGSTFTGLRLYKSGSTYRLEGQNSGILQAYFDSDGYLKAAGGAIEIGAEGIKLYGEVLWFYDSNKVYRGVMFALPNQLRLATLSGVPLHIAATELVFTGGTIRPNTHLGTNLGRTDRYFHTAYIQKTFVNELHVRDKLFIPSEA